MLQMCSESVATYVPVHERGMSYIYIGAAFMYCTHLRLFINTNKTTTFIRTIERKRSYNPRKPGNVFVSNVSFTVPKSQSKQINNN